MAKSNPPSSTLGDRMANATFKWEGDLQAAPERRQYGSGINWAKVASETKEMLRLNPQNRKKPR